MAKQAWAQNAIITSDDGGTAIRYRPRCPKCGHVQNRECGGSAQEGVRAHHSDRCDKCGEFFDIVISRG